MEIERLDPSRVSLQVIDALGLDTDVVKINSGPAIAASVRRAASFLCPTPPGALGRAVNETLSGLPGFVSEDGRASIDATVEALVSLGDLLELPLDIAGTRRRHLFLGPPSYVARSLDCILLGVRPEGAPLVGDDLLERVENRGHLRLIRRCESVEDLEEILAGEGLIGVSPEQWLRAPRQSSPQELVDKYISRLDAARGAGESEGIRVIDPASDVSFYRGRWRELKASDDGRFVARRPQAFGADLWCFIDVIGGSVERLIDLPIESPVVLGSDEAWRLQAAIDALSGRSQRLRVHRQASSGPILDLFSPLPSWSQRRLELVGVPTRRSPGALVSYALPETDVEEESRFLASTMWLSEEEETNGNDDQ